jgi:integrase
MQNNIKHSFNSAVKKAGLVDFHFHDLRHTFASQVLLNGGGLKDVQELLGHKSMTMTLRYSHLTQESKKKAVNLLNGLTAKVGDCHKTVTFPDVTKVTAAN